MGSKTILASYSPQKRLLQPLKTISEIFQWIVRLRTSHTLPLFFIMTSQLKHWKHYETQLITYGVIMKNNGNVRDVCSLACKIKVLKPISIMSATRLKHTKNRRFFSTGMEFAENAYAYVLKAPSRSKPHVRFFCEFHCQR